ncbi:hypothetical protein ACWC09_18310 [Streptomyces sp. NPDC001617]
MSRDLLAAPVEDGVRQTVARLRRLDVLHAEGFTGRRRGSVRNHRPAVRVVAAHLDVAGLVPAS